ncbi:hypothetical protein IB75_04985 [Nitrosococcus oceani C-27]|uniref:Uncharacterized protein n=1 Tax=Nitrosococcus oceani C-27 TaxID=314279 RepID=A0A0E2Z434_9GAMM|nr:hypothetical protein IB75_04985 [Nitrosococcus oceani C-27]KFI23238.1 hypothetical protein HW44_04855 [Nitrosococcus oceani]GEM20730.1 hypothetical protein NONS58_21500 [Nitrosococcus oceani]
MLKKSILYVVFLFRGLLYRADLGLSILRGDAQKMSFAIVPMAPLSSLAFLHLLECTAVMGI